MHPRAAENRSISLCILGISVILCVSFDRCAPLTLNFTRVLMLGEQFNNTDSKY